MFEAAGQTLKNTGATYTVSNLRNMAQGPDLEPHVKGGQCYVPFVLFICVVFVWEVFVCVSVQDDV